MLSCQKLSKSFGKKLFSDLNFNLDEGEILAVVGPSGCGKTTLLRCICGLEVLDSGKILLNERDITQLPAEERGIGLIFQKPVLYPHLSVSGNLSLASLGGHSNALVSRWGLPWFCKIREVDTLSGGEGQRVSLARALLANPRGTLT